MKSRVIGSWKRWFWVRKVRFVMWELVLISENHERGRSPAERLCWSLKELFEAICDVSAEHMRINTFPDKAGRCCQQTTNFWVIPVQCKVYRATWRLVYYQWTSADVSRLHGYCLMTSRSLENLNRWTAIQQRFRRMHLLACFAACFPSIKGQINSILPVIKWMNVSIVE